MLSRDLERGLAALGLALDAGQQRDLLEYLELLDQWNRRFNLTAVRNPQDMITRHLLDSLALLPHLNGERFVDAGTGAGLPGIPLAIARPEASFTLLDSNGKKTRFLFHVAAQLELKNIGIVKTRVEDYPLAQAFDVVLSRAFASLGDMIAGCRHLLAPGGEFLAMKGQRPESELAGLDDDVEIIAVTALEVPGLDEERCLVRLRIGAR